MKGLSLWRLALAVVFVTLTGAVGWRTIAHPDPMPARVAELQASEAALAAGLPPLVECPSYAAVKLPNGCGPAGTADDQGAYIVLPWLARTTGVPVTTLLSALGELYWIPPLVVLLGIPLLLFAERHWSRRAAFGLVLLMLVASLANSLRGNAGLPLLLGAFVALLLCERSRLRAAGLGVALVAAYLIVQPVGIDLARAQRDAQLGVSWSQTYPDAHLVWHSIYIGLGYVPNAEGLAYADEVGQSATKQVYATRAYEAALRDRVLELVRTDPGLVVRNLVAKGSVLLGTFPWWPVCLLIGIVGLRRRLLIALPAVAVGAIGPLLVVPFPEYLTGWVGAWLAIGAMGAWSLAARDRRWLRSGPVVRARPLSRDGWDHDKAPVTREADLGPAEVEESRGLVTGGVDGERRLITRAT